MLKLAVSVNEVTRFYARLDLPASRIIEVFTVDRVVSTDYGCSRFTETFVLEGSRLIDIAVGPEGSDIVHQQMIRKWSTTPEVQTCKE